MLKNSTQHRDLNALLMLCFLTILIPFTSLPLHASANPAPVELSPSLAAPPTRESSTPEIPSRLSLSRQSDSLVSPSFRITEPEPATTNTVGTAQTLLAAGAVLIPFDSSLVKSFPRIPAGGRVDVPTKVFNTLGDARFLLAVIAGTYAFGNKDEKNTATLALSALADAGVITEGAKLLAGRERPSQSDDATIFHGPGTKYNSFPSGHASAAFAVATVLADRHPNQSYLYYTLAAGVGLARIRIHAHFPSDVVVGAGIGCYSGNNALGNSTWLVSFHF